jgi:hypothetical protein
MFANSLKLFIFFNLMFFTPFIKASYNDSLNVQSTIKLNQYENVRYANILFFSGFGGTSLLAAHYETNFLNKTHFFLSNTSGFGITKTNARLFRIGLFTPFNRYFTLQNNLAANIGKKHHFAEIGAAGTLFMGRTRNVFFVYPVLSYKYIPIKDAYDKSGYYFKIFSNMNYINSEALPFVDSYFGVGFGGKF